MSEQLTIVVARATWRQWAGLLITMGTLGDRIGRRRLLLIGSVAFAAAPVTGPIVGGVMLAHSSDAR